jgi:ribosomal protein S18 acetylase RimI-like enzyme
MDAAAVQQVRAFNRTIAERIGALTDGFLGRGRPMGESRTLWEIGLGGTEIRDLRALLEQEGLITVETSSGDGRVRYVQLTDAGRAERAELDRRADEVAWSFLKPLDAAQRDRLVTAMSDVQRLLLASMVDMAIEDPTTPDARWCIEQYFSELNTRFETGFDPSKSIPADTHELVPPRGALLIARLRGGPIGCGALKFHPGEPAELKRMWVAPKARGLGLGRRLLVELERHAKEAGTRVVRLETNRTLSEAIQLYRSSGYREVAAFNDEPYAHHWFEKRLR